MKNRLGWIDVARGIGIILVIIGHTLTTVIRRDFQFALDLYKNIYYFHMPLMFFVSGVAFNASCNRYKASLVSDFISKKAKKLLVPYVSYSILIYIIFFIANSLPKIGSIMERVGYGRISLGQWIYEMIIGDNSYCVHLWFIYALFILSLIGFISLRAFGDKYNYILIFPLFMAWWFFYKDETPMILRMVSGEGIWFIAGTFVNTRKVWDKKIRIGLMLSLPLLILFRLTVGKMGFPFDLGRLVYIFIVLWIILFVVAVSQLLDDKKGKVLSYLGRKSFPIYLFHQPFLASGMGTILYGQLHLNVVICIVLSFVCCIVVPLLIDKILQSKRLCVVKRLLLG
ncbi:MAG: acyltransferase [Butyrivibrio sp.]|nr:acyltransferase [Butyrivibrio sp.]